MQWKTFGRVDLTDRETMREMASSGCLEIRYGIESGSADVLARTRKGFSPEEAIDVVSEAISIFPRVDCFYVWGFPFERMEDFYQSLFQMVSFRSMGARVLPSLLSFLPQTDIYREYRTDGELQFCPDLFPEYMVTGHEVCSGAKASIPRRHAYIFDFISSHGDLFPGFFHYDVQGNVLPKLQKMQEFGFYPSSEKMNNGTESCGAHSPRVEAQFRGSWKEHSPAGTATGAGAGRGMGLNKS